MFQVKFLKGIQVKCFTADQNIRKSLKCNITKIEVSTSCRFQDIAVQNYQLYAAVTLWRLHFESIRNAVSVLFQRSLRVSNCRGFAILYDSTETLRILR